MIKSLNRATEQIHVAAQYLAMAGKYYLPAQSDDSHTNMDWDVDTQELIGRPLGDTDLCLILRPSDLRLRWGKHLDPAAHSIDLSGKTQAEGVAWVKLRLGEFGLDPALYQMDLHYEVPAYFDLVKRSFQVADKFAHQLFSDYRSLAKEVMEIHRMKFELAENDRTWPHHFDHGCYVPLRKDGTEVTHSISFGLAIHDHLIGEHYFYVTRWSKEEIIHPGLPPLRGGYWDLDRLQGAAFPIGSLFTLSASKQAEKINEFLVSAIRGSLELLQLKDLM